MKKVLVLFAVIALLLTGCADDASVASNNLSLDADQFKIDRRIVFYNGITGDYILVIEGRCSLGDNDPPGELSVICKVGTNEYKKHFLGLSDNVTYFCEQIEAVETDTFHYKVIFKPESILPSIDLVTSGQDK
jgi:hypothetical protein